MILRRLAVGGMLLMVMIGVLEVGARIIEHRMRPAYADTVCTSVGEESAVMPHADLGFWNRPGRHCTICVNNGDSLAFCSTNLPDGSRWTGPRADTGSVSGTIVFLGGSLIYGHGIPDSCSIPYRVQQAIPTQRVINDAVNGRSTVQAWLRMKERMSQPLDTPVTFVYGYTSMHHARNTMAWSWWWPLHAYRSPLSDVRMPGIQRIPSGRVELKHKSFSAWHPIGRVFSWSRLFTFLRSWAEGWNGQANRDARLSMHLLRRMERLAHRFDGVSLLVLGVTDDPASSNVLFNSGRDISVDLAAVDLRGPEDQLRTWDAHPNCCAVGKWEHEVSKLIRD